jgi:nitrite reductase (NADH) large subunit
MSKQRLVIVGNGMAAARVVEELLKRGGAKSFHIVIFGEEPCPSYDRMQLADVMSGARRVEDILHLTPRWYEEHRIVVHWAERAVLVSRPSRTVYGSGGAVEHYDKLVFATGSSPHFPPIKNLFNAEGQRLPGVCDFRTLADCVQIVGLSSGARSVSIIGGGLLGLEAARGLAPQACRVELIHRGPRLLRPGEDEELAYQAQRRLEGMGVRVRLNRSVEALTGTERVTGLVLDDGTELTTDLVVIATGLIPNTWLAFQCGLGVERGIAVDGQQRAIDDRRIYALGECAQSLGKVYGLSGAIRQQAKSIAEHLTRGEPSSGLASTAVRERQARQQAHSGGEAR